MKKSLTLLLFSAAAILLAGDAGEGLISNLYPDVPLLAQLHQLRGRVGRGKDQSYCIFVNTSEEEQVRERLDIMNRSNDGFYIASEDLKLRGPGDIFGIRQSGEAKFQVADIFQDAAILKQAAEAVDGLTDPEKEELESRIQFVKYSTTA